MIYTRTDCWNWVSMNLFAWAAFVKSPNQCYLTVCTVQEAIVKNWKNFKVYSKLNWHHPKERKYPLVEDLNSIRKVDPIVVHYGRSQMCCKGLTLFTFYNCLSPPQPPATIGWFSDRKGTSVDDGALKSNNWLDQWVSGKLGTGSRV